MDWDWDWGLFFFLKRWRFLSVKDTVWGYSLLTIGVNSGLNLRIVRKNKPLIGFWCFLSSTGQEEEEKKGEDAGLKYR